MVRSVDISADGISLEKIDIGKGEQAGAYNGESPEEQIFLFHHS